MQTNATSTATGWIQNAETTNTTTSATIPTPAFGSPVVSGNTIICLYYYDSTAASINTVVDSASNAYTRGLRYTTGSQTIEMWYAENVVGGAGITVTANLTASINAYRNRTCGEYSGLVKSNSLDQKIGGATNSSSITLTLPMTTSAKTILWMGFGLASSGSFDGSFSRRSTVDGNGFIDKRVNTKASYSTTASGLASENLFIFAAFRAE